MLYNKKCIVFFNCLIAVIIAHGAEKKSDLYRRYVMPEGYKLQQVRFLTDNSIVINSIKHIQEDQGVVGLFECNIIDLATNAAFNIEKTSHNNQIMFLMIHGKKVVADVGKGVMVYDTETYGKTYIKQRILDVTAQPGSDDIFLYALADNYPDLNSKSYLIQYNCENQEKKIMRDVCMSSPMRMNPKEKIMCSVNNGKVNLFQLNDLRKPVKTICLDDDRGCCFCEYSSDGLYIAAGDITRIYIVKPDQNKKIGVLDVEENEQFKCIAFHPDGIHLALLVNQFNEDCYTNFFIKFFNVQTKKYRARMEIGNGYGQDFSFSDNGLKVVVGQINECIITKIQDFDI